MKLYWLDLETTGFDPVKNDILEVAVMEADFEDPFNARELWNAAVCTHLTDEELDPFILDMHTKNGLLSQCRHGLVSSLSETEEYLLRVIPFVENKDDLGILAGSSIHFDHAFIRQHMPTLAKRFSHRHYDVSSIALFCRSMGMRHLKREPGHRALDDVKDSIKYAKQCWEWLA